MEAADARLILLDAPVGYGKSTLLAQWCATPDESRTFAWLTLDADDSDPRRLFSHLVQSVRRRVPGFGTGVQHAMDVPGAGVSETVMSQLVDELAAIPGRLVIVLDDYHLLRGAKVNQVMTDFVGKLPTGTQLAVASRADPALPLGRLRATGAMLQLRAEDLRFVEAEAAALLTSTGISLAPADLSALVERTEGWPAALYLATLSLRHEPDAGAFIRTFAGSHRHIADYLSEQVIRRESAPMRAFLLRTAILDRLSGSLCDAVLSATGSQQVLEKLEHRNLFVVPLDDSRQWYRYHQLFGQLLRTELERTEPGLVPELHRRASAWFEQAGWPEEAVHHALAARDPAAASELIARHWLQLFNGGRLETVRTWLDDLGSAAIAEHPAAALTAAWVEALAGDPEAMERWLLVAESGAGDGPTPATMESGVAIVRGLFGCSGLEARRAWLTRAWELEPPSSGWRPYVLWGLGHVALLSGDPSEAERVLAKALRLTAPRHSVMMMITLAERSLALAELGRLDEAQVMAERSERIVQEHHLATDSRSSAVSLAAGAVLVGRGELDAGRAAMERALTLRRASSELSPWPTLEVLLALAPVRLRTGDPEGAEYLLVEARATLADLPDAGDLPIRAARTEKLFTDSGKALAFGQSLTDREIEVLKLLPSQLSYSEIGEKLFLSVNTIKSHNRAIYRKLGVSTRTTAIERARDLHLL